MNDGDLTLIVNGQRWSGWQEIRLTRGIERYPSDFDLMVTEKAPSEPNSLAIAPGQTCQVLIGSDVVLTGYIDRYTAEIAADRHNVRIAGRSKCEDLVDCSAGITQSGTWIGSLEGGGTALSIATTFAAPFGITVTNLASTDGTSVPQFYVNFGETADEIIQRVAHYAGFLAYDGTDGNLLLATPGISKMASGFYEGQNVQAANVMFTMDKRYSDYFACWQAVDQLMFLNSNTDVIAHVLDQGVPRFRPLALVSEQISLVSGLPLGRQRAYWERNRRLGRSMCVRITADSWRDKNGTLWTPNAYAAINIPSLKLNNLAGTGMDTDSWVISEVTYNRSIATGTTADLVLMPAIAFSIEPITLPGLPAALAVGLADPTGGAAT